MALPKIGLAWGTINQSSLIEIIEAAARHDFPTLSVPPNLYHEAVEAGFDGPAIRRRMADAGVTMRVIDAISKGLPGQSGEPMPYRGRMLPRYDVAQVIEVAEALEAPVLNATLYRQPLRPLPPIAEALAEACRLAAKSGITIALEFIPDSGIPDLATALELSQLTGEPNIGILLDTWHLARTGGTAEQIRALPPKAIRAFQLADRIEPAPGTAYVPMSGRSLPGEGELPLYDQFAAVMANNPELTIELEVFSEELAALSVDEAAARTASAMKTWRENAPG